MKAKTGRWFIVLATALLIPMALGGFSQSVAKEKAYPTREITVYFGFGPGGSVDTSGRVICKVMESLLGVPIITINKPGASSAIATAYVANSKPDGYTLLYGLTPYPIQKKIEDPSMPYSLDKLTFLGSSHKFHLFLTVRSDSPWKTYEQFVDYAKKNTIKFGSLGTVSAEGSIQAYFANYVGLKKVITVPYAGGGKSVRALLGGEVEAVTHAGPVMPYLRSGDFRALVFFGPERNPEWPDVPAINEKEKGFDVFLGGRNHLLGPKGMPDFVVEKLIKVFKEATESEEARDIFKKMSYPVEYLTPKQCVENWKSVEKFYTKKFKERGLK